MCQPGHSETEIRGGFGNTGDSEAAMMCLPMTDIDSNLPHPNTGSPTPYE